MRPSRRLGQSFLIDPFIADAEAALLAATPRETVVEIGGGLGLLTEALLRRGVDRPMVVERDRRLAGHLRRTFGEAIRLLEGDALEVDLPTDAAFIGNLPFSSGTPLLQRLWRLRVPRVVGLLQREVVERLAAAPGSRQYGRLTIQAALFGVVEPFQVVPSTAFEPAPEVEGRLFRFERRDGPLPVPSVPAFEAMVRVLFQSRRKQLGNLLSRAVRPPFVPAVAAREAGWPADWDRRRPEELPPTAYFRLATVLAAPAPAPRAAR